MNNALLTFQPYLDEIDRVAKSRDLEELRVKILGKQGLLSQELKALGGHSPDMRKTLGAELNRLKAQFSQSIAERRQILQQAALREEANKNYVDVSLPLRPSAGEVGRIHPISQVTEEITAIFADMGFAVAEGPDIESDDNNFVALNFPEGHPSREMHDTFFLPEDEKGEQLLLRTHTSPVQIRTMRQQEPPIRVIIPGRTYRRDSDQTHTPMFHQVEGLVIDETSHLGHLKWLLEEFLRNFFEVKNLELRFRPSHFPFTEPSFEADMRCDRRANEVKLGEGDDWMEILGCGMVHPNVLSNCGLDPDRFQGFAWGVGIDRLAMLKYGLADLRTLFGGDVRWIDHYGFRPYNVPSLFSGLSPD